MKERKELAVGETVTDASIHFEERYGRPVNDAKQEIVFDGFVYQVFHRRLNRTATRAVRRVGKTPYSFGKDARPVVITLHPNELIETRLKGRRKGYFITWTELHRTLTHRHALFAAAQARKARAEKRKARNAERKARR